MTRIEAGLSSTPRINDIRGKHLNISAFPALRLAFLAKQVFHLIGKRGCNHEVDKMADSVKQPDVCAVKTDSRKIRRNRCDFDLI